MPAFIFDMDGTLVDNMAFHAQSWQALLDELGLHLRAADLLKKVAGMPNDKTLRHILGPQPSNAQIRDYAERKEVLYRSLYGPHLKLIDGAADFIARARRLGLPLAVATSADRRNIEFVLGGLGVLDSFQAVVGAEDIVRGKPYPEIFLTAAARLGVPADTCVVFEDSLAGIEAAHRAGSRVVAVTTTLGPSAFQGLPGIAGIIEDYVDLDPGTVITDWTGADPIDRAAHPSPAEMQSPVSQRPGRQTRKGE
jgi:beta-phosphoglucomutase family hydrolase